VVAAPHSAQNLAPGLSAAPHAHAVGLGVPQEPQNFPAPLSWPQDEQGVARTAWARGTFMGAGCPAVLESTLARLPGLAKPFRMLSWAAAWAASNGAGSTNSVWLFLEIGPI
jgi:hypothetical protein